MVRNTSYRLFIDTASADAFCKGLASGALYGVTTNPTLLHRAGVSCELAAIASLAELAFSHGAQEFQAQVWGQTEAAYIDCGRRLASIAERIVVKLPMNAAGIQAARCLRDEGVSITMTAVYSAAQALVAASVGAQYIAPYYGRLADGGIDAEALVASMLAITGNTPAESPSRLLVASIRSAEIAAHLAATGCDTLTVSPQVFEAMLSHPDSDTAIAGFEHDALA